MRFFQWLFGRKSEAPDQGLSAQGVSQGQHAGLILDGDRRVGRLATSCNSIVRRPWPGRHAGAQARFMEPSESKPGRGGRVLECMRILRETMFSHWFRSYHLGGRLASKCDPARFSVLGTATCSGLTMATVEVLRQARTQCGWCIGRACQNLHAQCNPRAALRPESTCPCWQAQWSL